ncbi:hypothetical protein F2Q69_00055416 [Brassica cretica]|uniref:Uncharacterized protein n=2 Tax=Brassica cretica TaxID=69181 RepID=A0A8S9MZV2_BRACR|nr:hypothetical protein F2Q69_00055416 [Brassica cretica]KAF3590930.1 hypothetical protein DY000_02024653 [Brassica cretica]
MKKKSNGKTVTYKGLEVVVCEDASEKSKKAFWVFCRLSYVQLHRKKWSEDVQSLQHVTRGVEKLMNFREKNQHEEDYTTTCFVKKP